MDVADPHVAREGAPYEVVIVRYGTLATTDGQSFLNHWIHGEPDQTRAMDYFLWIARNRERTVVIDTGFSPPIGRRRGRTVLVEPRRAYDLLGVDTGSGPTVVITHAHYDHIGNLALFRHSPIVIAEQELAFSSGPFAHRGQFGRLVEDPELAELAAAKLNDRVLTFTGRHEVAPGIEVIEVGGHTAGQSMVRVHTHDGPVLLASDAVHFYDEYERDRPFAFVADLAATYSAYDQIRDLMNDGSVRHLVSGHDPDVLKTYSERLDVPAELAEHVSVIGRLG